MGSADLLDNVEVTPRSAVKLTSLNGRLPVDIAANDPALYYSAWVNGVPGGFCTMWVKLIVSVTLLPMLLHSILGCCWHHAHSEVKLECTHSATESHRGHRHQHDHRSEHKDPAAPVPCEHDQACDDVRCVYLVAESARNELTPGVDEYFAVLGHSCSLILNATVTATASAQRCSKAPSPSQHCALTQVWVI